MKVQFRIACLLALTVAACNPIYTSYDWDKEADFTQYKTYTWYEREQTKPQDAQQAQMMNPLMITRIQNEVDKALKEKGMQKVDEGPDVWVNYTLGSVGRTEISQTGYGYGFGTTSVRDITEGTLLIDLIDARSNKLVWRGIAENAHREDASPQEINDTIDKAVAKVMKEYPPKS